MYNPGSSANNRLIPVIQPNLSFYLIDLAGYIESNLKCIDRILVRSLCKGYYEEIPSPGF